MFPRPPTRGTGGTDRKLQFEGLGRKALELELSPKLLELQLLPVPVVPRRRARDVCERLPCNEEVQHDSAIGTVLRDSYQQSDLLICAF